MVYIATIVGSNNFGPWVCHLASGTFFIVCSCHPWGLPLLLCGMENCGLGFVCYQIHNLQETSWDFSSRQILTITHNGSPHGWQLQTIKISLTLGGPGPKVIGTTIYSLPIEYISDTFVYFLTKSFKSEFPWLSNVKDPIIILNAAANNSQWKFTNFSSEGKKKIYF